MKQALQKISECRVLVVGDVMLDRYHFGEVQRVSPEAPVPVVRVLSEEARLGGAANVAHNLAALGCQVTLCGRIGADLAGQEIVSQLTALGVNVDGLRTQAGIPTTEKLRIVATHQQLLRSDREETGAVDSTFLDPTAKWLETVIPAVDGVIISDYDKGVVSPALIKLILAQCLPLNKMVVADPKGQDYGKYSGVSCLTPNELEAGAATRLPVKTEEQVIAAGERLLETLGLSRLCITRGGKGVLAFHQGEKRLLPAQAQEVFDVTGAGDTFISVFGAGLLAGVDFYDAVSLANHAAGIAVSRLGTAAVGLEDLARDTGRTPKWLNRQQARQRAAELKARGQRIVFTNGCFDLIHAGHIQYLQASRKLGHVLMVGLNSDQSVRKLKGPERPLLEEEDRIHLLAALSCVDYVVIFEEETPESLIREIKPDVLTKGADYTVETVVGHDLVQAWGGQVRLIELKPNRSTSSLIKQIRSTGKED